MNLAIIDPGFRKARFLLALRAQLEPHIRCHYYSRRQMVRSWITNAGCKVYPSGRCAAAALPALTEADLRAAVGEKELIRRKKLDSSRVQQQLSELSAFLDECQADGIFVWNGSNLLLSLATFIARRKGLKVIFAEQGYLPGTLQLDTEGVNQASSLSALVAQRGGRLPPDAALDAALDSAIARYRGGASQRPASPAPAFRTDLLSSLRYHCNARFKRWYRERLWRRGHAMGLDSGAPLPERFVLVPLQVQKDSQLLLHSPIVRNDMRKLLTLVQRAVHRVDSQLRIVAKLHPQEQPHVQARNLELIGDFPEIQFVSKRPMQELLPRAVAVVTVNSTVGFEAFLYDKPVVALGRNFYIAPHLLETVQSEDQLDGALARAISCPVPLAERRALLRYLWSHFLVHGHYSDFSESSLRAVANRVRELLKGG